MSIRARSNHRALRFEALENRWLLAAIVPGFDANELPPHDDSLDEVESVSLPFAINFYGRRFDTLWVNNNGNVTFDGHLPDYIPFGLSTNINTPIIAAFFADVDTRPQDEPTDAPPRGTVSYGVGTFEGRLAFGVTFTDVGYFYYHADDNDEFLAAGLEYFNAHGDLRNSFQIMIVDRSDIRSGPNGSDFDIVFNYDQVQWDIGQETPDGAEPAVAGFANGTGLLNSYFQINGSLTDGAFVDSNPATGLVHGSRGSDTAGRYVFAIRDGQFDGPVVAPVPDGPAEGAVVVPVPYFPPASVTPGSTFVGSVVDGSSPGAVGRTNVTVAEWVIAPTEIGSAPVRTIFGTGFSGRLPESPSAGADPVDSIAALPATLPLGSIVDPVQVQSSSEDPIVSLLAALPMEHEEVALNVQTGKISGQVWQDDDGDGRIDQLEQPLFEQQVFLDTNGNGEWDEGEKAQMTDPTGAYSFNDLEDGVYLVQVVYFEAGKLSRRAREAIQVRISMQKREFPGTNFALPAPIGNEVTTLPKTDQPRWAAWLAGAGALATLSVAGLLAYAWRRKRDSTYVVWHTRISEGDLSSMRRGGISTALEDTVCEKEEPDVSKNVP